MEESTNQNNKQNESCKSGFHFESNLNPFAKAFYPNYKNEIIDLQNQNIKKTSSDVPVNVTSTLENKNNNDKKEFCSEDSEVQTNKIAIQKLVKEISGKDMELSMIKITVSRSQNNVCVKLINHVDSPTTEPKDKADLLQIDISPTKLINHTSKYTLLAKFFHAISDLINDKVKMSCYQCPNSEEEIERQIERIKMYDNIDDKSLKHVDNSSIQTALNDLCTKLGITETDMDESLDDFSYDIVLKNDFNINSDTLNFNRECHKLSQEPDRKFKYESPLSYQKHDNQSSESDSNVDVNKSRMIEAPPSTPVYSKTETCISKNCVTKNEIDFGSTINKRNPESLNKALNSNSCKQVKDQKKITSNPVPVQFGSNTSKKVQDNQKLCTVINSKGPLGTKTTKVQNLTNKVVNSYESSQKTNVMLKTAIRNEKSDSNKTFSEKSVASASDNNTLSKIKRNSIPRNLPRHNTTSILRQNEIKKNYLNLLKNGMTPAL